MKSKVSDLLQFKQTITDRSRLRDERAREQATIDVAEWDAIDEEEAMRNGSRISS